MEASNGDEVRTGGDYTFYSAEGMILAMAPDRAREALDQLRHINPENAPWRLEYVLNHEHLPRQRNREDLRQSEQAAEALAGALRAAWPERRFVVVNRLGSETLSFYQQSAGAELADSEPKEPLPGDTYCPACGQRQRYRLRTIPDAEYPELDWGECEACGNEVYIWARDRFRLVP